MFDFYAHLSGQAQWIASKTPGGFASGFVDSCTATFGEAENEQVDAERQKKKNNARSSYMRCARELDQFTLLSGLTFDPSFTSLPDPTWVGLEVKFTLESPWYSKDDRPFHVLDNPVRKDRVFGVPFMSAASWKGLLRWACRMQCGLQEHLLRANGKIDGWCEPPWIIHLFGNERGAEQDFQRGSLAFYPTWFSKLGFELINPHSRKTRAGTQPIYYEVVPPGTPGVLRLLYALVPGAAERDKAQAGNTLASLTAAIERLLTRYGISAKRTAGWGAASISDWRAVRPGRPAVEEATREAVAQRLSQWLGANGGGV